MTLSSVAQHLSSSVLGALNTAQSDLSDVASFASGRSGTSSAKYQAAESLLNGLTGQMSGLLGGSSGASTLA